MISISDSKTTKTDIDSTIETVNKFLNTDGEKSAIVTPIELEITLITFYDDGMDKLKIIFKFMDDFKRVEQLIEAKRWEQLNE